MRPSYVSYTPAALLRSKSEMINADASPTSSAITGIAKIDPMYMRRNMKGALIANTVTRAMSNAVVILDTSQPPH